MNTGMKIAQFKIYYCIQWQSLWKRAAGRKLSAGRMNSVTSEGSQNSKSITFDVAEAEALMNEFGIAAPLSGLASIQVHIILYDIQKNSIC